MSEEEKIRSEELNKFEQIKKANDMFELVKKNEEKKEKNNDNDEER